MKKCSKCNKVKYRIDFPRDSPNKDGLRPSCKACKSITAKEYYIKNREKEIKRSRYYYLKNFNKVKKSQGGYYLRNKETIKERGREYYLENKDVILLKNREYIKNNKESVCKGQNAYEKKRKAADPMFKLRRLLKNRVYSAFKRKSWRKDGTMKLLGCSIDKAFTHLENQFTEGMTWDNHGEWHIDHIIPMASAKTQEELVELCHYKNLQPLWALDNIIKSDKIL